MQGSACPWVRCRLPPELWEMTGGQVTSSGPFHNGWEDVIAAHRRPPLTGDEPGGLKEESRLTGDEPGGLKEESRLTGDEPDGLKEESRLTGDEPGGLKEESRLTGDEPGGLKEESRLTGDEPGGLKEESRLTLCCNRRSDSTQSCRHANTSC
ncbi:hypothetical protein NHX12_026980 [Muraenolepis orangiensis]|uniref:Uncharacterized protein n=1 Tax=Muraenolepis orangiensis TaxID=630683 RepID=A0A9Q0IND6_9TELE|nr:hypothetical protein NHX12_026980 [Muraenolepis orangiensis]